MKITTTDNKKKLIPVLKGESCQVGGIETFIPVCCKCFYLNVTMNM